ncbi:MAG: urocanate hydratase [Bacillota bacterium]
MPRQVKAMRGPTLRCKGWRQEGLLRMLENTVENGEKPEELVIYAATGKAARNWEAFDRIVASLKVLEEDQTLAVQSGKPIGVFRTNRETPLVVMANANLVGNWANWETFWDLEARGLMMYGQYTAGSWAYIGTQGIMQGTFENFAECARLHYGGSLKGRLVLTSGLGGMGSAQPLGVTWNGGVVIICEVDEEKTRRRLEAGLVDRMTHDVDEALHMALQAKERGEALSVALVANGAEVSNLLALKGIVPDVVTDQTSAHDALNGYYPAGLSLQEADELRRTDPQEYIRRSMETIALHVRAMLEFQSKGAIAFEYGNNIRGQARAAGVADAFRIKGFVQLFARPSFCVGRGPFRWVALSGDPADIEVIDRELIRMFPDDANMVRWLGLAGRVPHVRGLPCRTCWLGYGPRAEAGVMINRLVREGRLSGPVAMTRDHLDTGAVAQPTRETENMRDGSDAVADWPLLNALLNASAGADLVAIHQGAGSGMGGSISAGVTLIADGDPASDDRIRRVLMSDTGIGVLRHADAGYEDAVELARREQLLLE